MRNSSELSYQRFMQCGTTTAANYRTGPLLGSHTAAGKYYRHYSSIRCSELVVQLPLRPIHSTSTVLNSHRFYTHHIIELPASSLLRLIRSLWLHRATSAFDSSTSHGLLPPPHVSWSTESAQQQTVDRCISHLTALVRSPSPAHCNLAP